MAAFSKALEAVEPPSTARASPAATRLPAVTSTSVTSPLVWAVMVWRELAWSLPPAAQAMSPTRAVALWSGDRAPGLCSRSFTWRTRLPPLPTRSAVDTDSTVALRVSMVPSRVTVAFWPRVRRAASVD